MSLLDGWHEIRAAHEKTAQPVDPRILDVLEKILMSVTDLATALEGSGIPVPTPPAPPAPPAPVPPLPPLPTVPAPEPPAPPAPPMPEAPPAPEAPEAPAAPAAPAAPEQPAAPAGTLAADVQIGPPPEPAAA